MQNQQAKKDILYIFVHEMYKMILLIKLKI